MLGEHDLQGDLEGSGPVSSLEDDTGRSSVINCISCPDISNN